MNKIPTIIVFEKEIYNKFLEIQEEISESLGFEIEIKLEKKRGRKPLNIDLEYANNIKETTTLSNHKIATKYLNCTRQTLFSYQKKQEEER